MAVHEKCFVKEIKPEAFGADSECGRKKIIAIQDLSCIGRCSGSVTLPVLSAAGITVNFIPTALLSAQTDGFENYTFRDLTEEMLPIARHWQTLQLHFDAVYTSFLGSLEQLETVKQILFMLTDAQTLRFIDPVLGDDGVLYDCYDERYVENMRNLCAVADVITPNLTEAAFLTGLPYREGACTQEYILQLFAALSKLGIKQYIVITGVCLREGQIGVAVYDCRSHEVFFLMTPSVSGRFPGAGDVFASALLAAILNDIGIETAAETALAYTANCIAESRKAGTPPRFGPDFEKSLWKLAEEIRKKRKPCAFHENGPGI